MELYIFILFVLLFTAIADLYVGVANDAVNFLNSAIGSKVSTRHVILIVASLGILVGVTFSSGMMEVARKGIFKPEFFTMHEVMIIFLAVMITDIILLDFYNTFGLPTSTTVSLVFEILGGAFAVGLIKLAQSGASITGALDYIDSTNVLTIVSSIGLSIIFAFIFGLIAQFITRLIFTFEYSKQLKRYGALYSGFAVIIITFFLLVKGAKGSSFLTPEQAEYIQYHMVEILLILFVVIVSVFQMITIFTKFNILRIVVLLGTFSLALAFAANDLVNFIGAPMAAFGAYTLAAPTQNPSMLMVGLREPVRADTLILVFAGIIMVATLWFSRKARTVIKTEVFLGRQEEGVERFESSALARTLVRVFISLSDKIRSVTPKPLLRWIKNRIDPTQFNSGKANDPDAPSFDLPRASVNMIVSAGLISFGTSLMLPLSTTFVTFMVAMATSLADKSWGRDSAVYRVNGVITVIGGWFFTAFMAFTSAFIMASIIYYSSSHEYLEIATILVLVALAVFAFIQTNIRHTKRETEYSKREKQYAREMSLQGLEKNMQDLGTFLQEVSENIKTIYNALVKGQRKVLRTARETSTTLTKESDKLASDIFQLMRFAPERHEEFSPRYSRMIASLQIIMANLTALANNSYNHLDNNHSLPDEDQAKDLAEVEEHVQRILQTIIHSLNTRRFDGVERLQADVLDLKEMIYRLDRNQMKRIKGGKSGTRQSLLFIGTMSKVERIAEQSVNLAGLYRSMMEQEENT